MASKFSDKEAEFVIKLLNGEVQSKFIVPMIVNPKLQEQFANYVGSPSLYSEKEISKLFELVYKEFVGRLEKTQFSMLKGIKPEVSRKIIPYILNNPDLYEGGLSKTEITELVLNSNSIELIQSVIEDETIGLNGEQVESLMMKMGHLEELAEEELDGALEPEEITIGGGSQIDEESQENIDFYEDVSDKVGAQALRFTKDELFAIKVYEGIAPGRGILSSDHDAYRMINAMLFPGIENEIIRVCDDDQFLDHRVVENPEELLKISVDLYSAMYKYGKKMEAPAYTRRIDREASFPEIEKRGEIVSNFSTTTAAYNPLFTKENMVLVEAIIEQGAVCADFSKIFRETGERYRLSSEAEILVAPFSPVVIEDTALTSEDKRVRDVKGKRAIRKVKMRIKPPEKPKPLTPEEKKDKEQQMEIFTDADMRENASIVFRKLQKLRSVSKDEVRKFFSEAEIQQYIEWKNAYQAVYRYETRERALEIEKSLASELGLESPIQENDIVEPEIAPALDAKQPKEDENLMEQLSELSKTKGLSGINGAIKKIANIVKGKNPFSKSSNAKKSAKEDEEHNVNE